MFHEIGNLLVFRTSENLKKMLIYLEIKNFYKTTLETKENTRGKIYLFKPFYN